MSSRTEASTKQVSNRKPRNHTAKAAVDQFHASVDLGDGLSKTQSLQEQQLLCLASNVLLFENLLQPQYDATCLRHACDMPATCQQCCITPTKKDLTQSEKKDLGYIRLKKKYTSIGLYTETTWQIDKQDLVCGVNDHFSQFFVIVCRATKRVDRPLHTSCLPAWLSEGQRNFLPSQHQTLLLQPPSPWQSMTQEKVATNQHRHAYCTHHISSNSLIPSLCMDSSASKFYYFAFNVFDNLT